MLDPDVDDEDASNHVKDLIESGKIDAAARLCYEHNHETRIQQRCTACWNNAAAQTKRLQPVSVISSDFHDIFPATIARRLATPCGSDISAA